MTHKNPSYFGSFSWKRTPLYTSVPSEPKDPTEGMQRQMESLRKRLERIAEELEKLKLQVERHTRTSKIRAMSRPAS
jgi:hypothetical protein